MSRNADPQVHTDVETADLPASKGVGAGGTVHITAAPSLVTANFTGIAYAYTRVKLTGSSANTVLNVDANPQKL